MMWLAQTCQPQSQVRNIEEGSEEGEEKKGGAKEMEEKQGRGNGLVRGWGALGARSEGDS